MMDYLTYQMMDYLTYQMMGEVDLHIGIVLNDVVETELIQAVVADRTVIVVKLNFKAVSVVSIAGHLGQRGIALGPDGYVVIALVVDDHRAQFVLLVGTALQDPLPIIHNDVDGVDP